MRYNDILKNKLQRLLTTDLRQDVDALDTFFLALAMSVLVE
jgi:hypothetical protein